MAAPPARAGKRTTAYPCVRCGQPLTGKQKRYHAECRRLADAERKRAGTYAPNDRKVCAWVKCSNPAGQGRYCSDACRQAAYRARKKRK